MNLLFFLTPKSEVVYIQDDDTIKQSLEKMEIHKYAAIPIISRRGKYVGTITEGDLLWGIKNKFGFSLKEAQGARITEIPRRSDYQPVFADSKMEDLIERVLNQNFVPVLDDQKNFIGIITRKDVMKYLSKERPVRLKEREREELLRILA